MHARNRLMLRAGTVLLAAIGLVVAATALYVLAVPVSADDFEATAGTAWSSFAAAHPGPAAYLEREARLLAVGYLGFGLLAAAVAPILSAGERRLAWASWIVPFTLGAGAVVFLTAGGIALGAFYAALALASVVALIVARVAAR